MKWVFSFLLTVFIFSLPYLWVYADDYICLVDTTTGEATDIVADTQKNRATWETIKGSKEVKLFSTTEQLSTDPKMWDGKTVVDNTAKIEEKEQTKALEQKIATEQKKIAISALIAKSTDAKEIADLTAIAAKE